jgi:hypothetical protein
LDLHYPIMRNALKKTCKRKICCHRSRNTHPWNGLQNESTNQRAISRRIPLPDYPNKIGASKQPSLH